VLSVASGEKVETIGEEAQFYFIFLKIFISCQRHVGHLNGRYRNLE